MTCRSVSPAFSNLLKLMNASSWSTIHQKRSNPLKTHTWLNKTKSDFLWGWPNFLYHLLSVDSKSVNSSSPSTQTYFSFNWLKIILITRTFRWKRQLIYVRVSEQSGLTRPNQDWGNWSITPSASLRFSPPHINGIMDLNMWVSSQ